MLIASTKRSPTAWVLDCLSEPAKSTRFSFPTRILGYPSLPISLISTLIIKIQCERELSAFIAVHPVFLFFLPWFNFLCISYSSSIINHLRSFTKIPTSFLSLSSSFFKWVLTSKSLIYSLYNSNIAALTKNYIDGVEPICEKTCLKALGIIPIKAGLSSLNFPSIVYVLPVPVWPYAKIVPLKPSRTLSTIGKAVSS